MVSMCQKSLAHLIPTLAHLIVPNNFSYLHNSLSPALVNSTALFLPFRRRCITINIIASVPPKINPVLGDVHGNGDSHDSFLKYVV